MKLSISTLVLASALGLFGVEAVPSPASPTAPVPLLTRQEHERALVARERALLRPAWRPATPVIAVAPGANAPLRRSRGRAADGKNAFRHRQRVRQPHADADDSLITAAPVHIIYNADLAMPFPLARHLSSRNGHVKRDAAAAETDADEEDDWDCEEEEEQANDGSSSSVAEPSFTPSEASSAWSEPWSSSSSSSSSWSASSDSAPAPQTTSQEPQLAESTATEQAQPTSTPAATESDTRSNPKIAAGQSSSAQASSDSSASGNAPVPTLSGTASIRNATGDLPAAAAPVSDEPTNL